MKRYVIISDSPDRYRFLRLFCELLGFAAAGLGIVMLSR